MNSDNVMTAVRAILAAAVVALAAASAAAADAVLVQAQGQVYVLAKGAKSYSRAKRGQDLAYGDHVRCGEGAIAQIALGGRGAVLVRGNSSFTLLGDADRTTLNFRFGEFLIGLRRALTEGQTFQVRTPAAVAAVRGTLFWGKSDEAKTTTYAGFGHVISVTAQGKTVLVSAGQKTTVALGQPPAPPAPHDIPVSYLDNFKIGGSLLDVLSLVDLPQSTRPAPR